VIARTCCCFLVFAIAFAYGEENCDSEGFQWKPALVQSAVFLGLQHSFRFATEPDTRESLRGPFVRDYLRSVGNISGWRDRDPAFVNYVGHPIQGAVSGYIAVQNDPQYRKAEFGMTKQYWASRFRAMAFSAAYSLQFEIGPVSEASLGNVQMERERGVVDWVVTPTLGTAWMIAEDAVDKYLVRRIEGSTDNAVLRILARGWLNPTRSFSNMLRLKVPWHRDDRNGVRDVTER
jgi:hypothetical protein